jgi:endonuclease/exonuclease/phosphatase family metal-dependent hydrolase
MLAGLREDWLRTIILFLLISYATSLLVWCIGRAISGDNSNFILGLNYLGVWLFLPIIVFLPWVSLKRDQFGGILLVIPLSLFFWFYGKMFLPNLQQQDYSRQPFSVMTYNFQESNRDLEALQNLLESNSPDILALQEVSGSVQMPLSESLSGIYPHFENYAPSGLAVYSKYPILEYQVHPALPRPFQSLNIEIEGHNLHVINSHLANTGLLEFVKSGDFAPVHDSAAARENQVAYIKEVITRENIPTILACDCNMTNLTQTYAQITADFEDAFIDQGWGFGHTFLIPRGFDIDSEWNLPFQRIDYIFHSAELKSHSIRILKEDVGSDHWPLFASFVFQQ